MPNPNIHTSYDSTTDTTSFIVADPVTEQAVIINPVLNFETRSNKITTASADAMLRTVEVEGYTVNYILETGVHRDHISGCRYLERLIRKNGLVGEKGKVEVCIGNTMGKGEMSSTRESVGDGSVMVQDDAFDRLLSDGEKIRIGNVVGEVMGLATKDGEVVAYVFGRNVFVHLPRGLESLTEESRGKVLELAWEYRIYGLGTGHVAAGSKRRVFVTVREMKSRLDVMDAMANLDLGPGTQETSIDTQTQRGLENGGASPVNDPQHIRTISTASSNTWCECSDTEDSPPSASNPRPTSISRPDAAYTAGGHASPSSPSRNGHRHRHNSSTVSSKPTKADMTMMRFYATQINMRGGRIPKRINLMAQQSQPAGAAGGGPEEALRKLIQRASVSGRESVASGEGDETKEKEKRESTRLGKMRESDGGKQEQGQGQIRPLLIPRKLEGIMC
jgi:hypothetical protein